MHDDDGLEDDTTLLNRRRALGLGLTAAVAGLATVVGADPAAAASGDPLLIGLANDAETDPTSLTSSTTSGTLNLDATDGVDITSSVKLAFGTTGVAANGTTGVDAAGTTTGVNASGPTAVSATGTTTGVSASGPVAISATGTTTGISASGPTGVSAAGTTTGVSASGPTAVSASGTTTGVSASGLVGVSANGTTTGVSGTGGIGGTFGGSQANLLLTPAGAESPPLVNHSLGEIFVSASAGVLVCVVAGNPGTFVRLGFNPVSPFRVCDTRPSFGPLAGQTLTPGGELVLPFLGVGGVPTAGVSAVVFNLTMSTCTADGWLTAYPNGEALPGTSNLNFAANQSAKANLVAVKLGTGGIVRIYNARGNTNVIVDLFGFYS